MTSGVWDAIIVGGRCAGAVTALCLARRGHRVLVLDKARFPSDTLSTHNFGIETTARFARLGLLDAIEACGAPPIRRLRMAAPVEGVGFTGRYRTIPGIEGGYCIRRILLDDALLRAAHEAGAEVRDGTTVVDLIWEEGQVGGVVAEDTTGRRYPEIAQVVVGADGRYSRVAKWVGTHAYARHAPLTPAYYAYFRGVLGPRDTCEMLHTSRRDYLILPTDSDFTCALVALPQQEIGAYRMAHERNYRTDLDAVPELRERFAAAERVGPVRGATDLEGYLRVPVGPGWALVGDAGAHVHPVTARGIGLAVRDAELLAAALSAALSGARDPAEALSEYHRLRDAETEPAYQQALRAAEMTGKPLPEQLRALWAALDSLPDEADAFVQNGGAVRSRDEYDRVINRAREAASSSR